MIRKSEKRVEKRSFTDRLRNSLQGWKRPGEQRKKRMVRAGTALACIVAFTTTYALILPAITLDRTPQCGQEEHIHTEDCYAIVGLAEGTAQTSVTGTTDVAELSADAEALSAGAAGLSADGGQNAAFLPADASATAGETPVSEANAFAAAMLGSGLDEFVIRNLVTDTALTDSLAAEFRHAAHTAVNAENPANAVTNVASGSDPEPAVNAAGDTVHDSAADSAAGAVESALNGSNNDPAGASDANPAEGRRVLICGLEEHHHSRECYTANDTDAGVSGDILTDDSAADPADSEEAVSGSLTESAAGDRNAQNAADHFDEASPTGDAFVSSFDEEHLDGDADAGDPDGTTPSGDAADNFEESNPAGGTAAGFDEEHTDRDAVADDADEKDAAKTAATDNDRTVASDSADSADGDASDGTDPADSNVSDDAAHADGNASDTLDPAANGTSDDTNPASDNASDDTDFSAGNTSGNTTPADHAANTTADPSATGARTEHDQSGTDGSPENTTAGSGSSNGNGEASSYNQESSTADATLSGDSDRPEDTSVPEALKNGQKKYNFLIRVRDAIANFVSTGWRRTAEVSGTAISAEYDKGVLPETALMKVHTVDPEPYSDLIAEVTGKENTRIKAFDLSFRDGSEEVEPDGTVKVTFKADFIDEKTTPQVIHITDDGHAEIIPADVADGKITLTADSFSVYAISYTVDFSYGDYHWSLEGGSSIKLSELFNILGILADVQDVTNVIFSDPDLVKVEKAGLLGTDLLSGGDWELTSLRPFSTEELLTVTFQDGTVLNIPVTDDQEESTWKVNINLLDYNGSDPATQEELALISGKTYAIVATVSDKQTKAVLGYRVQGAVFENGQSSTTCEIGLGAFKTLKKNSDGKLVDTYQTTFPYDPASHDISIRLYEGTESVGNIGQYQHKDYGTISGFTASANGFEFLKEPYGNVQDNNTRTTTLNMKRAYDKEFRIRLNIDPSGLEITDNDRYYAFVTVKHATTDTTYAYAPVTVAADQTIADIPITDWYDRNGNKLPNEKFTGNETVTVELYTTNKDGNGNKQKFNSPKELNENQVKVLVSEGSSVKTYNVYYGEMQPPVDDEDEKKTYYFSTIDFHAPSGTISKGDLDRLLDDATDFGYYTERYIGHSGDIEATIGADYLDTKFQDGLGYSSANVNVNRLKVLKLYTDGDGNPVQKPVTIQLVQDEKVVAEKSGTTDATGKLELEFEGLPPGEFDIVEVIDGQKISGQGSASVSGQTINYNFSIDKAHFANNKNVNYFGKIGEGQDLEALKTMLDKASRVDLVILTDTQTDLDRLQNAKSNLNKGTSIDVVLNGTAPYKKYDIKSDMVRLRQLSDDLAEAQSSDTIRVVNLKASEMSENGLNFEDDGRYIVLNIEMDQATFCPYILLDGKLLESDYGQSGKSNSSKVLYNLRSTNGGRYDGLVNTSKQGAGIILAPDANAHILDGPFGGTIITHKVDRQGNELHSNNPNQIQTLNAVIQNVIGEPKTGILQLSKQFADNTKDKVTYFTFKVKLENNDPSKIQNVSFPATGLKTGSTVTFDENGEALVLVRAGNSVAIANLPGGTTYSVEEVITPETAHFQLDHYDGNTGTIEAGKTSSAKVFNTTIPLNEGFVAKKTVNGKTPTLQQRYDFKLDEYKDGKWTNIQTQPNTGSEIKFAKVEFTEAGTYYYKIYEDITSVTDLKPDKTVYLVKVDVTGTTGNLQYQTTYYEVKNTAEDIVTGEGLGTLNSSNVELVTTALFDNKDQISIKKVWANGNTGGNTEIQYTLYRTTTKPEYVDVKVKYPNVKVVDGQSVKEDAVKTYKVMKGSELTLLLDHVWWDDSVNYDITSDVSSVSFSKDGSAKDVIFNYVRYSETTYKAIVPTDTTTNTINITVNYGNNADLYQYMAPIMEVKPPVGEVVEGYEKVALTGGNGQGTWLTGINGLDEKDGSDNPYYYYVYEESLNVDVGENIQRFETTYSVVDKSAVDGEELTINNRIRPAYAWVEVTKDWPEISDEKDSDMASATIVLYRRLKGSSDTPEWYAIKEIRKSSTSPSGQAWTFGWYVLDNNYEYFVQETTLTRADGGSENLTDTNGFAPSGWSWGMPVYSQQGRSLEVLTSPISNGQVNMYYKVNTDNGGTVTISNKKRETRLDKIWTNAVDGKIEVNGVTYNLTDLEVTVKLRMYVDGKIVNVGNEQEYLGNFYDNWKTAFDNKVMDGTAETRSTTAYGPKCYESDPWVYIWEGLPDRGIVDGKLVVYTYAAEEIAVKTKSGTDLTQYFTKKSSAPGFYNIYINNTVEDNNTPKTGVTVEKKWFRGEKDVTGSQTGSVTFDLYRTSEMIIGRGSSGTSVAQSATTKNIELINYQYNKVESLSPDSIDCNVGDTLTVTVKSLASAQNGNQAMYIFNGEISDGSNSWSFGDYWSETDTRTIEISVTQDLRSLTFKGYSAASVTVTKNGEDTLTPTVISRADLESLDFTKVEKVNSTPITISSGSKPAWTYSRDETLPKYVPGTETEWHYFVLERTPRGYIDSYEISGNRIIIHNTESDDQKVDIKLLKVDGADNHALAGARFSIHYCSMSNGTYTVLTELDGITMNANNWFEVPEAGLTIRNLGKGFYRITEEISPEGYVITNKTPVEFEVQDDGTIVNRSISTVTYWSSDMSFTVPNDAGVELPSTGGIGTRFFTIFGSMLIVLSGAMLMVRRRRERS